MTLNNSVVVKRLAWSLAAALAASFLVACGGGSKTVSSLKPARIVAFGDATADVGFVGGAVYSVNDGTNTTWVKQVAASYSLPLAAQSAGGNGWGRGGARVAPGGAALSLTEQINAFLAAGGPRSDDLILLSAGLSDVTAQADAVAAAPATYATGIANVEAAALALAAQANRLKIAGAKYITTVGVYNLSGSPYATATLTLANKSAFLADATVKFNNKMQIELQNLQLANVLLNVDAGSNFSGSGLLTANAVCTTPTALTCTPLTLISSIPVGSTYNSYAFADDRHFTPGVQRSFGDLVAAKLRDRF